MSGKGAGAGMRWANVCARTILMCGSLLNDKGSSTCEVSFQQFLKQFPTRELQIQMCEHMVRRSADNFDCVSQFTNVSLLSLAPAHHLIAGALIGMRSALAVFCQPHAEPVLAGLLAYSRGGQGQPSIPAYRSSPPSSGARGGGPHGGERGFFLQSVL